MKRTLITALAAALTATVATSASASYVTEVLADNPVAYYQFGDASIADGQTMADSSGNNLDGSYFDEEGTKLSAASGLVGQAASFDTRKNDFSENIRGEVADDNLLDITGDLTLEALIRPGVGVTESGPDNNSGPSGIISKYQGSGDNRSWQLAITTDQELQFVGSSDGTFAESDNVVSDAIIPLDAWSHVAAVYDTDGSTASVSFYIDGQLESTKSFAETSLSSGAAALWIGRQFIESFDDRGTFAFDGLIDEAAIYDTALSAERIEAHFNAIPEPASLALLGVGLAMMAPRRRR